MRGSASPHPIFGAILVLGVASGRPLLVYSRIQLRLVRQWIHVDFLLRPLVSGSSFSVIA